MGYGVHIMARFGITLEIFKIAFAAGLSWLIASTVTENEYPIFAPLSAILTTQVTISDSVEKGIYRILGVIVGVTIGGFFGSFFIVNAWSIFFIIGIGITAGRILHLHPQIISQIGVSTLLVLEYGHSQGYMVGRIGETIIGALIAVLINIVISPTQSSLLVKETVIQAILRLTAILEILYQAEKKEDLSAGLYDARKSVQQIRKEHVSIIQIAQGFRYTPFHRSEHEKMKEFSLIMNRLEHISLQVQGIARSLLDLSEADVEWQQFQQVLHDVQICLAVFARSVEGETKDLLQEALIMAVRETRANFSQYFISIQKENQRPIPEVGAIFSDLGRILDEIEDKFPDLNEKDVLFRSQLLKIGTTTDD